MSWPCYMVEESPDDNLYKLASGEQVRWSELKPGAMYWDTRFMEPDEPRRLSVKLPDGHPWLIDSRTWKRTGEPPNITVTPSINAVGTYHGWLQNGVLTDDCEGRKFE